MDVQTLINRAGGVGSLAARLSVSHSTVCGWKRTGFVPGNRVFQISVAFEIPPIDLAGLVKPPTKLTDSHREKAA